MEDYTLNSMQDSFHQRNIEKFGDTAGRQCTRGKCDLDIILTRGDQLYKSLNRTDDLNVNDLPDRFRIGSVQVQVEYNINNYGILMCNAVSREGLAYIFSRASE